MTPLHPVRGDAWCHNIHRWWKAYARSKRPDAVEQSEFWAFIFQIYYPLLIDVSVIDGCSTVQTWNIEIILFRYLASAAKQCCPRLQRHAEHVKRHWSYNFGCMWTRVWTCHHLSIIVAFLAFLILTLVFVLRQLGCWAVLASYGFGRPRRVPQHGRKSLGQSNSSMFQQIKTRELGRNRCCMMLHDLAWCCMMLHDVAWCCMYVLTRSSCHVPWTSLSTPRCTEWLRVADWGQ